MKKAHGIFLDPNGTSTRRDAHRGNGATKLAVFVPV